MLFSWLVYTEDIHKLCKLHCFNHPES
uniref:Uncharacterized protein n=1 Tax=Anguilla anguilla TaxID=7936 RepID=A0A0E9UF96_ANGAN